MAETDLPTNWGRWGDADQLGTPHLIDDAARKRAAAEVREAHPAGRPADRRTDLDAALERAETELKAGDAF